MALRLADAGLLHAVWRRGGPTNELSAPVTFARSPEELAGHSDIVCVCVPGEQELLDLVNVQFLRACRPESVLVVHSTVSDACCMRLEKQGAPYGVAVVDAPVCGGPSAARSGTLLLAAGGPLDGIRRCSAIFAAYTGTWRHVGPTGTGQRFKLLINLLYTANVGLLLQAREMADRLGLDGRLFSEFLTGHPSVGFVGSQLATRQLGEDATAHGRALLAKDLDLAGALIGSETMHQSVLCDLAQAALGALGAAAYG
jgi:3-hydroxyisobutyrate dehydrogenase-like beta-hydroxyacid dehydrogenase